MKRECPAHRRGAPSCKALCRFWGLWPCSLERMAVGLLFLPRSCWGVERPWDELCAFLFLVHSGCKPEHLSLSSGMSSTSEQSGLRTCGLCKGMVQNLSEGEATAKGGLRVALSLSPLTPPQSITLCPSPLLPGHSLCRSGIFCRVSGSSSLPFTHLATMGLCYGLKERGTDMCCSQVDRRAPSQPNP